MKLVGAVIIFLSCLIIGFRESDRLKKRTAYLKNVQTALNLIETEISFGKNHLKRIFEGIEKSADCCGLFSETAENIEKSGIKKSWNKSLSDKKDELCLKNDDLEALMTLGNQLGMTDAENQIKNIRYIRELLEKNAQEAEGEYNRLGRLYRSGGIMAGLLLILLLF